MGDDARRSDGGPVSVAIDPTSLRIFAGYLVQETDDGNYGCTLWPLMTVDELASLIAGKGLGQSNVSR